MQLVKATLNDWCPLEGEKLDKDMHHAKMEAGWGVMEQKQRSAEDGHHTTRSRGQAGSRFSLAALGRSQPC